MRGTRSWSRSQQDRPLLSAVRRSLERAKAVLKGAELSFLQVEALFMLRDQDILRLSGFERGAALPTLSAVSERECCWDVRLLCMSLAQL